MKCFLCTGLCVAMFLCWLGGELIVLIPLLMLLAIVLASEVPGLLQPKDEWTDENH